MNRETGEAQASGCITCIEKKDTKSYVKGIVFDTTARNTRLPQGACIRIEKYVETKLV